MVVGCRVSKAVTRYDVTVSENGGGTVAARSVFDGLAHSCERASGQNLMLDTLRRRFPAEADIAAVIPTTNKFTPDYTARRMLLQPKGGTGWRRSRRRSVWNR